VLAVVLAQYLPRALTDYRTRYGLLLLFGICACTSHLWAGLVYREVITTSSFGLAYLLPIPGTAWTQKIGHFAFGIYLMHQIPLEILDLALSRAHVHIKGDLSSIAFLICSAISFAACWTILAVVNTKAQKLKPLVGL
jgi:uncharacterized membrane protein YcfT